MLVFAMDARRVLEIGTFSGYSALSMAAGMAPGGRIITCEVDERNMEVARRHIAASPFSEMIEIRTGPALETIAALSQEPGGLFDLIFIDADKEHYPDYYDALLPLLSSFGLIAADNTLWSGRVLDESNEEESTRALRVFNDRVVADPRVVSVMLTIRDGITLISFADRGESRHANPGQSRRA